ncbi:GDSL-type esterase/lipase family protein [Allokutzneria albata]|uniref:GDSL-like Lipase/Acylhydrolase family protein n=1 Tax=Allokutzneria albata TaxID=211114 RepID=A0A1G9RDP1_ALLAB|nr:GDSL-type esterase/lipase family protein [Allokutzneria albata]SDM20967.1 GDSL-like Lipase/Acylhydrolase family protein [Allokutzneria albata]
MRARDRFRPLRLVLFTLAVPIIGASVLTADGRAPVAPGPPAEAPHAVVALGDSSMSGEGVGDYEPGTNGENGNWCHRSNRALVHHTAMTKAITTINLACSGAIARDVGLTDTIHHTERSQAQRLAELARLFRVTTVVVQMGANDDPGFARTVTDCAGAWLLGRPAGCAANLTEDWPKRVDRMVPKVGTALADIRTAMRKAGYRDDSYSLVVQSYAAPVGPNLLSGLQSLAGCPFRLEDLQWVRTKAVYQLSDGLRRAADSAGARFLDLADAGIGHEACSSAEEGKSEWFTRLTVNWGDLRHENRARHAMQESFHPNGNGHEQIGRCLGRFLRTPERIGACVPSPTGDLDLVTGEAALKRASG